MTLFDTRTVVLPQPAPDEAPEDPRRRLGPVLAVLVPILVVLTVVSILTVEVLCRAEEERAVAAKFRTALAIPDSERVEVDVAGSALLQAIAGRFDEIEVAIFSYPSGRANVDLSLTAEGVHPLDHDWTADRVSGAVTLSAAQATALVIPVEAQGVSRVAFSGGDMILDASFPSGTGVQRMSIALTPHFEAGRVSMPVSSVTFGGKALSLDELAAQSGFDPSAAQPSPLCLAEVLPRALRVRDVRVSDQRLRMEVDVDLPAAATPAGQQLGSCS